MQKNDVSMSIEIPYKLYKADAGGYKFSLKPNLQLENHNFQPAFYLIDKHCPHDKLYEVQFSYDKHTIYITTGEGILTSLPLPEEFSDLNEVEVWMTWIKKDICVGTKNKTFFTYPRNITGGKSADKFIGYIKFETNYGFDWKVHESPVVYKMPPEKKLKGGKLHWVAIEDHKLPQDAMIGGFEKNPIYIARAMYSGSLCPGKYVPEERKAYVAWGGEEHEKSNFQILCGYNAKWVLCTDDNIPENAFVAGTSEIQNEPLYIGRAFIDYKLIVGKVHMLYKTCYLPYRGEEIEVQHYEILLDLSINPKGYPCRGKCKVNVFNKDLTCI
ncbi:uncharacterized protein LOC123715882 isoform X1 [Pieris brassicae]|uniref:Uncharacterized protein n=1 Tax=Pieris brassicae TaxID=7116 RepID=A0A9P0TIL8_PIEBR|nr:uncharacterized protein LOC123715882 isoform X1 [Pieris brassicae]CAH4028970.1 unnamed protein product [Pieris brassicae]